VKLVIKCYAVAKILDIYGVFQFGLCSLVIGLYILFVCRSGVRWCSVSLCQQQVVAMPQSQASVGCCSWQWCNSDGAMCGHYCWRRDRSSVHCSRRGQPILRSSHLSPPPRLAVLVNFGRFPPDDNHVSDSRQPWRHWDAETGRWRLSRSIRLTDGS